MLNHQINIWFESLENIVSKRTMKIGDFCREQILLNKSPKKIVKKANALPNGGKVNLKHIAWYAWDMRKETSNHYCEEMPSKYTV